MTKFRHLPVAGRLIVVAVAVGVFAIAVVACATSYNDIYRLVGDPAGLIQRSALHAKMGNDAKAAADWEEARKLSKKDLRLADGLGRLQLADLLRGARGQLDECLDRCHNRIVPQVLDAGNRRVRDTRCRRG